jgi:hypothetical protein
MMVTRPAQLDAGFSIQPVNFRDPETAALIKQSMDEGALAGVNPKRDLKFFYGLHWDGEMAGYACPRKDADGRWHCSNVYLKESFRDTDLAGEFFRNFFAGKKGRALVKEGDERAMQAFLSIGFYLTPYKLTTKDSVFQTLFLDLPKATKAASAYQQTMAAAKAGEKLFVEEHTPMQEAELQLDEITSSALSDKHTERQRELQPVAAEQTCLAYHPTKHNSELRAVSKDEFLAGTDGAYKLTPTEDNVDPLFDKGDETPDHPFGDLVTPTAGGVHEVMELSREEHTEELRSPV